MKKYNIAIVGATGVVGQSMLEILEEKLFPVNKISLLASSKSAGQTKVFKKSNVDVQDLDGFDFSNIDIALFSAGSDVSEKYAPLAASQGAVIIDNTSFFRYDEEVPLIIPEVNAEKISEYKNKNIIANPNCSTIQMLVAIHGLHKVFNIKEIVVSTYQAVSGAGKDAIKELVQQTTGLLSGQPADTNVFSRQIAFNVIPFIDVESEGGYSKEEMKMVWETKKILNDQDIIINPTAVRVPTCYGHAEAINLKFSNDINIDSVKDVLRSAAGVEFLEEDGDFPTPFEHGSGTDSVYVGRVRMAIDSNDGINMWVVADNVRKGAALNAIQIAQILVNTWE